MKAVVPAVPTPLREYTLLSPAGPSRAGKAAGARTRPAACPPFSAKVGSKKGGHGANSAFAGLLDLDARELDHPRPLCNGLREDRLEFRRRAA
jgi:hypothetical protein